MKKLMRGAAALLAGWLASSTPIIFAQDLASGEPNLPLPLYHARPDAGGSLSPVPIPCTGKQTH